MSWVIAIDGRDGFFDRDAQDVSVPERIIDERYLFKDMNRALSKARNLSKKLGAVFAAFPIDPFQDGHIRILHHKHAEAVSGLKSSAYEPKTQWEATDWSPRRSPWAIAEKFARFHGKNDIFCRIATAEENKFKSKFAEFSLWVGERNGATLSYLSFSIERDDDTEWTHAYPIDAYGGINFLASETFRCTSDGAWITPNPYGEHLVSTEPPGGDASLWTVFASPKDAEEHMNRIRERLVSQELAPMEWAKAVSLGHAHKLNAGKREAPVERSTI